MEYSVGDFVKDLRAAAARRHPEAALLEHVKPLLARLARSRSWLRPEHYECDEEQGFGVHVLHEEPEHGAWLVAVSWLPHRGPPPHDHGTWAVVAGIDGEEENISWRRRGAGLEAVGRELVGPGQVVTFPQGSIHSVVNRGERTSLSLHAYGRNQNHAMRSQFDAQTGAETPFKVKLG